MKGLLAIILFIPLMVNAKIPFGFMPLPVLTSPVGQIEYTTAGTYSWTVPADVYSVSAVVIGGGGGGTQWGTTTWGGAGGALSYKNEIPVTPGQVITITVGAGGNTASTSQAGAGGNSSFGAFLVSGGGQGGNNSAPAGGIADAGRTGGGNGGTGATGFAGSKLGGSAGTYTGNGAQGGGAGSGLKGPGSTPTFGAGGTSIYSGTPTKGQNGAVRIIWGDNRSYPSTNVTDLPLTLVGGSKTPEDCTTGGGTVVDIGSGNICRFNAATCPGGWSQYLNWSTTTSNSQGCTSQAVSESHTCKGVTLSLSLPSVSEMVSSGSHTWANIAREVNNYVFIAPGAALRSFNIDLCTDPAQTLLATDTDELTVCNTMGPSGSINWRYSTTTSMSYIDRTPSTGQVQATITQIGCN